MIMKLEGRVAIVTGAGQGIGQAFGFVVSLQSIPRRGVPADIAPAVAFLASEEAHWITGQMLTADGGYARH
jgi:pyridoxal 4-dehydrogenase